MQVEVVLLFEQLLTFCHLSKYATLLLSNRHSIVSILVLGLYTIPAVLFLKLSCSSFTIHLSYFIAQQQACIQIAATIYTQACPHTSSFCFLLYQLSLWWVKYRAQPEAINPWKHAGHNAPWQAETSWGEKVKPRKPAWNQAFLWLSICGCQVRNKNLWKKNKPFRVETDMVSNSERLLLLFFRFELFSPSWRVIAFVLSYK